jgi:outer membrane immunogenic protein
MLRIVMATIAAFATLTTAAAAADLPTRKVAPVPPAEPAFSWTGFYLGANVGGDWIQSRLTADEAPFGTPFYSHPDTTAFGVGGQLGYRYQFSDNVVAGVEADASALFGSRGKSAYYSAGGVPGGAYGYDQSRADGSVRLTLGYAMGRWLPYATGGVAFLDERGCGSELFPTNCVPRTGFDDTRTGWTVGGGGAYAFTDHLIGNVEFRYADFGSRSYSTPAIGEGSTTAQLQEEKLLAGLSWKF